ncbi:OmpH family outer membrane protein [bacterium]|nr:OmpH family outer membrane protein [bacterium]MBU1936806.1 OmpH family outer membrane protein [bacterium]
MKRLSFTVLFLLILPGMLSICWARDLKVGYIDSERILTEFPDSQAAQAKLAEENREWETQAGSMRQQVEDLETQLEQQKLLLSDEKKAEKLEELQSLYFQAQQFQQEIWGQDGKLFQRNLELTRPVVEKINAAITKIGDEENYDFIFDATQGNIVHAKAEYDITDRVLELLQKE